MTRRAPQGAWGNFRLPEELGASKNRISFTGYIWDEQTSLFFARARFHDPKIGRLTTQDGFVGEISELPSLYRYLYAGSTRHIDRTGHAGSKLLEEG